MTIRLQVIEDVALTCRNTPVVLIERRDRCGSHGGLNGMAGLSDTPLTCTYSVMMHLVNH